MKIGEYKIDKSLLLKTSKWVKEQCRWKYWKRNTLFAFLIVNLIFMIGTYKIYFGIAATWQRAEPVIYSYCALAELVAVIGLYFLLFSKYPHVGEFVTLTSIPWLMFFGFGAAVAPFIINGFQIDIIGGIPSFIYHAFMFIEGIIILLIIKTEDIVFPVALGTAALIIYIMSAKELLTIMLNYFFKI